MNSLHIRNSNLTIRSRNLCQFARVVRCKTTKMQHLCT